MAQSIHMDSIFDNQPTMWTMFNTASISMPDTTWSSQGSLEVSTEPTASTATEFQLLCDYLESVSYVNGPTPSSLVEQPTETSHVEYYDVIPALTFTVHPEQPFDVTYEESVTTSGSSCFGSPVTPLSPNAVHAHSPSRPSPQHQYLLDNQFLGPHQEKLRVLLQHCLESAWLNDNALEPNDVPRRSILLGFLQQNAPMAAFKCQFDGCAKEFERQDRALGHIRMHLSHRPYKCNSRCGNPACVERFCCRSYLQSHLVRLKDSCKKCGKALFRQNMRRHNTSCPGKSDSS